MCRPALVLCLWPITFVSGCGSESEDGGRGVPEGGGWDAGGDTSAGTGGEAGGTADSGGFPVCPMYAKAVTAGLVQEPSLTEASGVVASRKTPGVLWVHNDSGDPARVFAISDAGVALGMFLLGGASAVDWEDIAIGPGPVSGQSYLYLGDIGDNGESRSNVEVYRVAEPAEVASAMLAGIEQITLVYPDHPHNAETLLVDPSNGDLYIVAKSGDGISPVFRAAAPVSAAVPITLEQVTTLTFGAAPLAGGATTTAGDISADGSEIAIRTYGSAFLWRRAPGATIAQALATEPCPIPLANEGQGEALGFAADGSGYYTLSEGTLVPLSFYARQ